METSILIVEDEPLIARDISFLLEDIGIENITMAMSYDEAKEAISSHPFHLILLDINLSSDQDGVDLAHWINQYHKTPFIFITSYYNPSVVARAKVTEPKAYLLKPFNKHDIQINVEMALHKSKAIESGKTIFIKEQSGTISVDLENIIYLEADDNYTKIFCTDKDITISQTLKTLHEKLPENNFVRVHKSYCVNLQKITMIKGGFAYLSECKVPIGRTYKEDFMSHISLI